MSETRRSNKANMMEQCIRTYFDGCNSADVKKMTSCFTPDAVHYFPPDMYDGPWHSAETIARKWQNAVANIGSYWTIDSVVVDEERNQAVIEFTHFKTKDGTILRGAEWYLFDNESGLIRELRAYYASPQAKDLKKLELGGYDYKGRGYSLAPPPEARNWPS